MKIFFQIGLISFINMLWVGFRTGMVLLWIAVVSAIWVLRVSGEPWLYWIAWCFMITFAVVWGICLIHYAAKSAHGDHELPMLMTY